MKFLMKFMVKILIHILLRYEKFKGVRSIPDKAKNWGLYHDDIYHISPRYIPYIMMI